MYAEQATVSLLEMNMKIRKSFVWSLLAAATLTLTACGGDKEQATAANSSDGAATAQVKHLKWGVCPGPYGEMVEKAIAPILKDEGYEVEVITFTDYVQPNLALDSGDINVNLMQHRPYFDNIIATQKLKLTAVTNVPTLGMGIFSDKYQSVSELQGGQVGLPNDAVNLARALQVAQESGILTLAKLESYNKASLADIAENPYNLDFAPMDAAQLPRSLDSLALALIPGNYAYASKLDYSKALGVEQVSEPIKNVIAIREGDQELYDLIFNAIHSEKFIKLIEENPEFDAFTRPAWWEEQKQADGAADKADAPADAAAAEQAESDAKQATDSKDAA